MLKIKGFSLIKPTSFQISTMSEIIEENEGSVFQEFDMNKIVEKEFGTDLYYLVDNPEKIINFSPIHITRDKIGMKKYHFKPLYDIPYAGFVDESVINFKRISIGFFESFIYCGLPQLNISNNTSIIRNGETSIVDLSLDENEIFNNVIHSKRRNMIRKAVKSGIEIKKYFGEDSLEYFWPMLETLHKKLGYHYLKRDYYQKIIDTYSTKNQVFVLVAFKNNVPISGILVLGNKNFMHYYKGTSVNGIKNEGQGELLQWDAIKIAKSMGAKYYDLCNLDKDGLPFIYKFKTGISNKVFPYSISSKYSIGYKAVNKISYLFD